MNYRNVYNIWLVVLLLLSSCDRSPSRRPVRLAGQPAETEVLAGVNRQLAEKDKDVIEAFIRRKGWTMETNSEGYYRMLLRHGKGTAITAGAVVELGCDVYLLNGTPCYLQQTRTFQLSSTNEISGLHKGLLNLHVGDKVRFIFPPHMAYGLQGDKDKIPPRAIIWMEVEVLTVNSK